MRLQIKAIGRLKPGPERDLIEVYRKRMSWQLDIHEIDDRKISGDSSVRKAREAELLLADVPTGAAIVALDERGKDLTSRAFSDRLIAWRDEGRQPVTLLIGGADGLDRNLVNRADLVLSLGKLTWPHMMVRAMLTEQLFRAQSIHQGHPYHRD